MNISKTLTPEEREELVFQIISWLKKWGLWEEVRLYTADTCYSSSGDTEEPSQCGWRGWTDVWVSPRGEVFCEEFRKETGGVQILMDYDSLPLESLFESGTYSADFDALPDAARITLFRNINLFTLWKEQLGVDDWYQEMEDFRQNLNASRHGEYRREYTWTAAQLVLMEFRKLLEPYQLFWYNHNGRVRLA